MPDEETSISRRYGVVISKPDQAPMGISILLPGTMLKLKSYNSTQDMLISKNQLVIGFQTLNPFMKKHSKMAEDVANVVKDICALKDYAELHEKKYNIVGHSLGERWP